MKKQSRSGMKTLRVLAGLFCFIVMGAAVFAHATTAEVRSARAPVVYVGEPVCSGCHAKQSVTWQTSQHAHAMAHATEKAVLGNFENVKFHNAGVTTTFFRRNDEFWVSTDGADGELADFKVSYTFGVYPLQQYLIEFPDGRMQALSIAWDARLKKEGGQRWFHLYPDQRIESKDELHWTRSQQNWNYMCADCHSTNLRRNYDTHSNTYATTWSDISVACESCHGPGSAHVEWAKAVDGAPSVPSMGLTIPLNERKGVVWVADAGAGTASRSSPMQNHREVETCAVCHSRRGSISTNPGPTGKLLDTHKPSLLVEGLYYADGQQEDEVYTYGSFLQSKMYAKGVTCSDCHDPHTAELRAPGNTLCAQCHTPAKFDTTAHTHHEPDSPGAQCVSCHMPTRDYMVVDPRRDHSLRIPRPDLSVKMGTPNACNDCHTKRGPEWAAATIENWFGPDRKGFQIWGPIFDAARKGQAYTIEGLERLFSNPEMPGIVRATALTEMRRFPGGTLFAAINEGLYDDDSLVRVAALDALTDYPPAARIAALRASTSGVPAVSAAAGRALAPVDFGSLSVQERAAVELSFMNYETTQSAVSERPEAHLNLGLFHAERGDAVSSEAEYRLAIQRDPQFAPAYANLADLYRATNRDVQAERILEAGLTAVPDNPSLLHSLGLMRIRQGRQSDALEFLARSHKLAPDPRFAYIYAVALRSYNQPEQALRILDAALAVNPNDPDLLYARLSYTLEDGDIPAARKYATRFVAVAPEDARTSLLLQSIEQK
ncbi:tetratricopeptide repeat protein [Marinobacter sp. KMM 10035]|uniref:tetratricopeptide repeat protein n=1 Tax=Marinobacter sp. KMM 10035 TaxID=3134034 RepID=UPI00397BAC68